MNREKPEDVGEKSMRSLKLPLTDEHYMGLGKITSSFAILELQISFTIWELIDPRDQMLGQIITAEQSFSNLLAMLSSLIRHRDVEDSVRDEVLGIVKEASQLEQRRNTFTHSVWAAGNSSETRTRTKTTAKQKHGLKHQFEQVKASEMVELADEMLATANKLISVVFKINVSA